MALTVEKTGFECEEAPASKPAGGQLTMAEQLQEQ